MESFHDPEAIADELNPLTMSHTARTISNEAIGRANMAAMGEKRVRTPNTRNKLAAKINGAPIRPQTDKNRGTSLD